MRRPSKNLSAAAAVFAVCALAIWTAARSGAAGQAAIHTSQAPAPKTARSVQHFSHVVDLTHTLNEDTPYIPVPGITFPFKKTTIATISRNGVAANRWDIHEHLGTQIDAPTHFFDEGLSLERLPVATLVVPLVVIDVSRRAASNADTAVTIADIEAWEQRHGR